MHYCILMHTSGILERFLHLVDVLNNYEINWLHTFIIYCSLVGEEDTLLALLAFHGPVAVAVNALTWQFYLGGVIQYHCDASLENLNHAVQLVGYNLESSPPYYIARNSWGKKFGEKGYIKIAIGSNVCGEYFSYSTYLFPVNHFRWNKWIYKIKLKTVILWCSIPFSSDKIFRYI